MAKRLKTAELFLALGLAATLTTACGPQAEEGGASDVDAEAEEIIDGAEGEEGGEGGEEGGEGGEEGGEGGEESGEGGEG